jgi:uncharacterized protein (TIGR02246 family)
MEKNPADILALFIFYRDSVYAKDPGGLASIYDADVRVFDMWSGASVRGKAAFLKSTERWFSSLGGEKVVVGFSEIEAEAEGGIAFASANVSFKAIDENGNQLRGMTNRLTWNLVRRDGSWLIIHQHTSVPIDPGTVKAVFDS